VRRRATRRRWTNGGLATLTAVVVMAGSVVGIQAALGHRGATQQGQEPTPSEEPTSGTSVVPPVASADIEFAIWPVTDGLALAGLQAGVTAGGNDWVTDPEEAALRFARDIMGWDPADIGFRENVDLLAGTAQVVMWNRRMGNFSPGIAETVSLSRVGGTSIWLIMRVSTGLLDVQSPSLQQDVVEPSAPLEVTGTVTQPPAGWILRTTMEYAGSLLQPSEAQTSDELTLDGQAFDVTLEPIAVYSDGPTLSLRLLSGDGTLLGLWARRFVIDLPSPSPNGDLPQNVVEKRAAILRAAGAGDYSTLGTLVDPNQFTFTFGGVSPGNDVAAQAVAYWKEQGPEPAGIMAALLRMSSTTQSSNGQVVYVWPFAATMTPAELQNLTADQMNQLRGAYKDPDAVLRSWVAAGGYTGWRLGITADGRWIFFVAGD